MNTVQYIQVGSRRFWDVALPVRNLQDHFPALKDLMVTGRPLMLVPKGPPSPGNHFARRDYMMKTVSHFSESAEMEKRFYLTDDRYDADAQRRIMAYLGDVVTSVEAFFGNRQSRSYGITLTLSILPWVSTCKELNGVTGCVRVSECFPPVVCLIHIANLGDRPRYAKSSKTVGICRTASLRPSCRSCDIGEVTTCAALLCMRKALMR